MQSPVVNPRTEDLDNHIAVINAPSERRFAVAGNNPDMNTKDAAIFPYLERTQRKMTTRNKAEIQASVQAAWDTLPDITITRACHTLGTSSKLSGNLGAFIQGIGEAEGDVVRLEGWDSEGSLKH